MPWRAPTHKRPSLARSDHRASSTDRGYGHRWRKERAVFLAQYPLCVMCKDLGKAKAATVVDHIVPHKGNYSRFWDVGNWQALCSECHNKKTGSGQ